MPARIGRPPRQDLAREFIEPRVMRGDSVAEIARALDAHEAIIERRLAKWGLRARRGRAKSSPELLERLRQLANGRLSYAQIARMLSREFEMPVSYSWLQLLAIELDLPRRTRGGRVPFLGVRGLGPPRGSSAPDLIVLAEVAAPSPSETVPLIESELAA